jgi:hypothetical protein
MADGGGARPEFERGRGFRRLEAVVRAWGAVGRGVALERGAGEEWVIEERMVFRCVLNGRSAVWQRGKKGERGGGSGCRSTTRHGTASWGLAQSQVVVPLTSESVLLAARGRAWAGPRLKWSGRVQMNSKVLYLFELV